MSGVVAAIAEVLLGAVASATEGVYPLPLGSRLLQQVAPHHLTARVDAARAVQRLSVQRIPTQRISCVAQRVSCVAQRNSPTRRSRAVGRWQQRVCAGHLVFVR